MVKITINGRHVEAKEKFRVLDACRANNYIIETLCAQESVSPYGNCRMCVVEITTKDGKNRVTPSCISKVEEGLDVKTNSDKVIAERKLSIQKLMARAPKSEVIKELAKKVRRRQHAAAAGKTIRIACCARYAPASARKWSASTPSVKLTAAPTPAHCLIPSISRACIACGSCAEICPTAPSRW